MIIIEGPEKAGKTTLINQLVKLVGNAEVRKWGQISPDDRVYMNPLLDDFAAYSKNIFWDRAWVREYVYATLLNRDRRLKENPFLGEWLYGRGVLVRDFMVILLANRTLLQKRRDSSDLPVAVGDELRLFKAHHAQFPHWRLFDSSEGSAANSGMAYQVLNAWAAWYDLTHGLPVWLSAPHYAGHPYANVVFVEQDEKRIPGGCLPFTGLNGIKFGSWLYGRYKTDAFRSGYVTAYKIPGQVLKRATIVVAFGDNAYRWAKFYGKVTPMKFPALGYLMSSRGESQREKLTDLFEYFRYKKS